MPNLNQQKMRNTEEVVNHHLQALSEGLDSILSDYNETPCIIGPERNFNGLDEISILFKRLLEAVAAGVLDNFKVNRTVIDGELAYFTWEAKPLWPMATDTFIVRDGKILYQTFAIYANS